MTAEGCQKMTAMRRAAYAFIAALVLIGMAVCEDAPAAEPITIATGSPGGSYLAYGQGLARILTRELGQEVTTQSTQGPAQNILLIERKQATLAFITMGVGLQAWNGSDWTKGTQYRSMRVIFPMYDTAFQFVAAKRLHLHWLEDLAGLHIGAGPRAGTAGIYLPRIFNALDIKTAVRFGAYESMTSQLKSGDVEAIVLASGVPTPALTELIAAEPVDFVQPSADQIALIRKALPEISRSTVPTGTYSSLARDYQTVGLFNFAVAHKDLPDDLVYKIVKTVFDNREELVKAESLAKEIVPANIGRDELLPLHPGAARYYREIGVPIPVQQTQ